MVGTRVGSYSCFCSRANIVLFFTREAFCRRSIEERRVGEMESRSLLLRLCQKSLGELVLSSGEDWNGDESVLRPIFCKCATCVSWEYSPSG